MSGKPPKSPGISPMRVKLRDEGESKSSVGRLKKLKRRISASFRQLSLSKESSGSSNCSNKTNDGSIEGIEADQNHLWGLAASHSLNSTPNSKSRQLMSVMGRSLDGILEPGYNGEGLDDGEFDHNHQRSKKYQHIENVAAMSVKRHHSSAGDFIAINNHVVTACRSTTPLRLRPSRPKSEGNLSVQSLRAKRTSSFGCNSPFGKVEVYQKQEQLGKGSYATVYKGFSLLTNSVVALKEIHLEPDEGTPFTAIREASLLKGLKHTNIVTLHDIVHTKNSLTLVFEYLPTDLGQYLEKHKGGLNPHNIKLFLFQLLRGLSFCHDRQILHRDLKPQNLLISESGDLKLADFGLARAKSVPSKTFSDEVVTLWYRPPDLLLGSHDYSTSIDIWGVGCIFIEMVTGVAIFPGVSDVYDQLDRIWQVLGTPTERSWPGVTSFPHYRLDKFGFYASQRLMQSVPKMAHIPYAELLAHGLLQLQPNKRISSHDAMRHPYFGDLPTKIFDLSDAASIFTLPSVQLKPEMDELLRIRPHIRTNPHAAKSSTAQVSKLSYNQHSGPSAV